MGQQVVKKERAKQIRPALDRAIRLIIEEGRTLSQAAETSGMAAESLSKAMAKPHVKAFYTSLKREWLSGETAQAWHTVRELRVGAVSEKVRLDAAKTVLAAAGELEPDGGSTGGVRQLVQIIAYPGAAPLSVSPASGVIEATPAYAHVPYTPAEGGQDGEG